MIEVPFYSCLSKCMLSIFVWIRAGGSRSLAGPFYVFYQSDSCLLIGVILPIGDDTTKLEKCWF